MSFVTVRCFVLSDLTIVLMLIFDFEVCFKAEVIGGRVKSN